MRRLGAIAGRYARPPARDRPGPEPGLRLLDGAVSALEDADLGMVGVVLERTALHDGPVARRRALLNGVRPQRLDTPRRRVVCHTAKLLEALGARHERTVTAGLSRLARLPRDVVPEQLGEHARRGVHIGVHSSTQLLVELPGALLDPLPGQREACPLRVVELLLVGRAYRLDVRPEGVVPGVIVTVLWEPQRARFFPPQPQARLVQALRRPVMTGKTQKVVARERQTDHIIFGHT